MDTTAAIHQLKVTLWDLAYTHWKTEVLFSVRWWAIVTVITIAYAIWWKLVDKRRLSQILLFGSFVAVGRIVMDIAASNAVLWSYDIRELPFSPSPFLHDFTLTPLGLMIVYQHSPSWKKFLVWTAVVVGVICFVFFPLLITFGYLTFYYWNYFYSFFLMVLIASLSRAVLLGIMQLERRYQSDYAVNSFTALNCQPAMKPLEKEDDNLDGK